jgi:hypothetical protein
MGLEVENQVALHQHFLLRTIYRHFPFHTHSAEGMNRYAMWIVSITNMDSLCGLRHHLLYKVALGSLTPARRLTANSLSTDKQTSLSSIERDEVP